MNILVKLHLMSKASGRTVREELEYIVENAFQAHNRAVIYTPELAAMAPNVSTSVETPSNPALAFSAVISEAAPDPTVVPEPILRSEPVSINRVRPSPRRPHPHGRNA